MIENRLKKFAPHAFVMLVALATLSGCEQGNDHSRAKYGGSESIKVETEMIARSTPSPQLEIIRPFAVTHQSSPTTQGRSQIQPPRDER